MVITSTGFLKEFTNIRSFPPNFFKAGKHYSILIINTPINMKFTLILILKLMLSGNPAQQAVPRVPLTYSYLQ